MKNNIMFKAMAVAVVLLLSVAGKVNAQSTAATNGVQTSHVILKVVKPMPTPAIAIAKPGAQPANATLAARPTAAPAVQTVSEAAVAAPAVKNKVAVQKEAPMLVPMRTTPPKN